MNVAMTVTILRYKSVVFFTLTAAVLAQVLRKTLDSFGLNTTEIVAADKKFEIASDILSDKELAEAVSIIG